MAQEPITVYSRAAEPAAVAAFLRERAPKIEFDAGDNDWTSATVTFGRGKAKRELLLLHNPDYYAGPDWPQQMSGMRGYLSRFPDAPNKERALGLPSTFAFSLGTQFDPDFDPDGDPRLELLFALTQHLDGVLFTPSSLRDASGRVLFGADEADPDAVWPKVLANVSFTTPMGQVLHEMSRPRAEDEGPHEGATPPDAARVARRALALVAVTGRALLEQDDPNDQTARETHAELKEWVAALGIDAEFEPDERTVLNKPLGKLTDREQIDSTWRLEGLVVLAWALNRFELPAHDELVTPSALLKSLCVLNADRARELLAKPDPRTRAEIGALRNRLFALHWRLRNFSISPAAMNFAEFARTCWFGPLDITGLPLADGDLTLRGERIDRATPDAIGTANSAAVERHKAANWLWEGPETYSDASDAT